jgi:penicillin amidase
MGRSLGIHWPKPGKIQFRKWPSGLTNGVSKYALALRFSGLVPGGFVRTGLEAMRARTGRELVDAYRSFTGGALNLVWADQAGNIGWHVVGAIPRRTGFNGKYPMPGWTGEYEWQGMIPWDEVPSSENPGSHMIVTANV